jgi:hypothetical protein
MGLSKRLRIEALALPLLLLAGCCGTSGNDGPERPPETTFEGDSAQLCEGVGELCQAIENEQEVDPQRGVELCALASSLADRVPDGPSRGTLRGHLLALGYMGDDWADGDAPPAEFCMEGLQLCDLLGHLHPE